jgi:hypothetical protein
LYTLASSEQISEYWDESYVYINEPPTYGAPHALYYLDTEAETFIEASANDLYNYT